jgi:23S rRNA pseudouridine1911/1915/1917 synthase
VSEDTLAFVATADDEGRIDHALARRYGAGRRRIGELFERGAVRIDGKRARKGDRIAAGSRVELAEAPVTAADLAATPDPDAATRLAFLWERDDALAISKPAGMPSQPLRPGERGTAASGIVARYPECATASDDPRDGGLVHRLDIGTSGVLLAARTRDAWRRLRDRFGTGDVIKRYVALCTAEPRTRLCQAALRQIGTKVVVDEADGLAASTEIAVIARAPSHVLVACTARTGRMHQVRVHLAHAGAPIAGDALYGGAPLAGQDGFFLHAAQIRIAPESIDVTAPLPDDKRALVASLFGEVAAL